MQGNEALQTLINVHFICSKLYKHLKPRPAMLYFTFNEVDLNQHRFKVFSIFNFSFFFPVVCSLWLAFLLLMIL